MVDDIVMIKVEERLKIDVKQGLIAGEIGVGYNFSSNRSGWFVLVKPFLI